jgi:hypothetical protein
MQKQLPVKYVNMFVSQVNLSRFTLEPCVDQLVATTVILGESIMMIQLCRHNWEVTNLQQCAELLTTPIKPCLAGQHAVKLRLRRITCAADDNAICQYEGSSSSRAKR